MQLGGHNVASSFPEAHHQIVFAVILCYSIAIYYNFLAANLFSWLHIFGNFYFQDVAVASENGEQHWALNHGF